MKVKKIGQWVLRKIEFCFEVGKIACAIPLKDTPVGRGALLGAYLKLQFKKIFYVWLLKRNPQKEKVLGFKVRFIEYWIFTFLFDEIFIHGDYAFKTAKEAPLIIDCGSNIGMSILYFKKAYPASRIMAFEPGKAIFGILKDNMDNNHLQGVTLINKAVHDSNATLDFYYDQNMLGSIHGQDRQKEQLKVAEKVEAVPLADFIVEEVDFMKMDIEGAEGVVLEHLAKKGRLRMVREMVIEYHHHLGGQADNLSHLLGLLETQGFGYLINTSISPAKEPGAFQDILIHAYRKNGQA